MVEDMPQVHMPKKHVCEACLLGKMHCFAIPKDGKVGASSKLLLVHSDVCGPMQAASLGGFYYFVTFIDDFTGYTWIFALKSKSEVFICFKHFIALAENETGLKIANMKFDKGGNTCQQNSVIIWQPIVVIMSIL